MKRITVEAQLSPNKPWLWKATSSRFGVSAYGRTVAEAKQRLFVTVNVEKSNCGVAREHQINAWASGYRGRKDIIVT